MPLTHPPASRWVAPGTSCILLLAVALPLSALWLGVPASAADAAPAPAADQAPAADALSTRIAELIEQLGDPQYVVREQAQAELQKIGPPALDALTKAMEHRDVEVQMRARYLLSAIKIQWTDDKDPAPIRALMKNYDQQTEDARMETIQELARAADAAEIEVLCRVVRYERSHKLSKRAALLIVGLPEPTGEDSWTNRAKTINAVLGPTSRIGAEWVRAYLLHRGNAEQSLKDWQRLVAIERQTLKDSPRLTSKEIVGELLQREIDMLDQLGRSAEAVREMHELVPLESGQAKSVARLVQWLVSKKAWDVIDEVYTRFGQTFDQDPLLLYTLAEARMAQGKDLLARQVAAKALALGGNELIDHLQIAYQLQERGLNRWAEQEFRRVIAIGPGNNELVLQAFILMAEMFHDEGQEQEAGKALAELVDRMDADPAVAQLVRQMDREPGSIRSRMQYFLAEQERLQGNVARQTELLDKAIANDATDADVLIAMYRLPNQTDARRQQTIRRIKEAADAYRRKVQESPNSPSGYNQLAWLLGNTLGETEPAVADEAIRDSLKSLELRPGFAGFLDTLGRCYFAKKDFESAVRYQSEAARLEPHSGLIQRQLEVFQKALAASRKPAAAGKPPKS